MVRDLVVRSRKTLVTLSMLETCRPDQRLERPYLMLHMWVGHRYSKALIRAAPPIVWSPMNHSTDVTSIIVLLSDSADTQSSLRSHCLWEVKSFFTLTGSFALLLSSDCLSQCFSFFFSYSVAGLWDMSRLGLPVMARERPRNSGSRTSRPARLIVDYQLCATDTRGFDTRQCALEIRLILICKLGYR
jgi:hypothetical protein